MTKVQQIKLEKIEKQLDKLTGHLIGVNGVDGFINVTNKALQFLTDGFNDIKTNMISRPECKDNRSKLNLSSNRLITIILSVAAIGIATYAALT